MEGEGKNLKRTCMVVLMGNWTKVGKTKVLGFLEILWLGQVMFLCLYRIQREIVEDLSSFTSIFVYAYG